MEIRILDGKVNRLEGLPAGVYHRMFDNEEEATEFARKTGKFFLYSVPALGVYFVEVKE
jgi:hypothetical protein